MAESCRIPFHQLHIECHSQDIERSAVKICFGIVSFFSSELGRSVGRWGREM
jgi:hypothetical protein